MNARARRARLALIVVACAIGIVALFGVADRAAEGRQAILRWQPAFEALESGANIYARPEGVVDPHATNEGYPTLPLSALFMGAVLKAGPVVGCLVFAAVKLACAALLLIGGVRLARTAGLELPLAAQWLLLLLTLRVMLSDVSHGNTNLLVGATVVATALWWSTRRDGLAGGAIALGATLKVTPLLLLALPLARRSPLGLLGFAIGLLLFVVVLPGALLGFDFNLELIGAWYDQMLAPYLSSADPGPMQTQQINQSLLGAMSRLTTDSLAIEARGDTWPADVSVALVHLDPASFRCLHRAACAAVVGVFAAALVRRPVRHLALAHVSLGALAMLLVSERSWKHHHVTLALPIAWCCGVAFSAAPVRERAVATAALVASLAGHALSGSGVLGDRGSDLAEAFGAFTFADLALFGAVAWTLFKLELPPRRSGA
ncbi:glycosyltransferase 87 family protein [Engelhardtia mirabilis]|uniref:DUF2029 domain-containing protein n=1 Tax=Engelhardtia mirabilis TaxID=2528011 RepID=A0A518BSL7_9BACT|nr:hypothetical protein Pla133_50870 [Planctomycetes bacterium Pla133]QDV04289.1 hypothetical protein Pla86_50840 [Planctomycetes bacterium Pla86]